jgi:hypothetical protein
MLAPGPGGTSGNRLRAAYRDGAQRVEDIWGVSPAPEVRLVHRRELHAACILGFVALAVPGVAIWGTGFASGQIWLRWIGAIITAAGSCLIAVDVGLIVRQHGTNVDYQEWDRAGRPGDWVYRTWSQPRSVDLLSVTIGSAASSAFFIALLMQ